MKKLLIASLITLASHSVFAVEKTAAEKNSIFAKATQLYEAKNYPAAWQELQRIADTGNAQAIYNLGTMTQEGKGTTQDNTKAIKYYQDASTKGYGPATLVLARAYHHGNLGLAKNSQKYKEYLDRAAQQGSEEAIVEYADLLFKQGKPEYDQVAIKILRPLIRKDYPPAQNLKAVYDLGIGVKNKNPIMQQQALESLYDLVKKGYAPSMMILGNMLANGGIVDQNLEEAKTIFSQLAKVNYPNAKESLVQVEHAIAAKKAAPTQSPKK
jgi:TPR repeat protein